MSIENGHPFKCDACDSCYTTARFSARCCKESSTDLRDGTLTVYSDEAELEAQAADEVRREALYAEHHYECSCGESYRTVEAASRCRKCRTYTSEGHCSEVYDRNTSKVVWTLKDAILRDLGIVRVR
jgi:hypothetical protein